MLNAYDLFLFDFDGLLVNTEELHYRAYQTVCHHHNAPFDWSFERYCQTAHYDASSFREQLLTAYPKLSAMPWEEFYAEKQATIIRFVETGRVSLMPGVKELLGALQKADKPHCVVTHSPDRLVNVIREQHPILNAIPYWITRHHYTHPKPHSECYIKAIATYSKPGDKVIGFEDTPRGLQSLLGTDAQAVLITTIPYPEIPTFVSQGAIHLPSLEEVLVANLN